MSDQPLGPGWWEASDDKWYPPESHPSAIWPAFVPRVGPATSKPIVARANRDGQARHAYVWVLPPVVAAGLVIAIVLALTLGGPSDKSTSNLRSNAGATPTSSATPRSNPGASGTSPSTSTSAPHVNADRTNLTGTYVGDGDDTVAILLEIAQSGSSLTGTISIGSTDPAIAQTWTAQLIGRVDPATNGLSGRVPTWGASFTGTGSGSSIAIDLGKILFPDAPNNLNVVLQHGTVSEFLRLNNEANPSVADQVAQSNLAEALTEAKALYQVSQAYKGPGGPYGPGALSEQAPEFVWTGHECNDVPANCMSYKVLDVASTNDAQGIALAVYSPATMTCWYVIDIETVPRIVSNDSSAFVKFASDPNAAVTQPGVYYARSPVGGEPTFCVAADVLYSPQVTWGTDYATAGTLR